MTNFPHGTNPEILQSGFPCGCSSISSVPLRLRAICHGWGCYSFFTYLWHNNISIKLWSYLFLKIFCLKAKELIYIRIHNNVVGNCWYRILFLSNKAKLFNSVHIQMILINLLYHTYYYIIPIIRITNSNFTKNNKT